MCRLSDGAWRGGVPRQTGKKVTKIFSSLPLIISNPGCERGRCSRRSVRPQPNRDLSLCNQTGIRLQLIFLCSLFITQRVPFIMLWSPSGAPPKPCPWMHPCAKGGDISRNFVIRICCMSKVSSMMNQEAAWKNMFLLGGQFVLLSWVLCPCLNWISQKWNQLMLKCSGVPVEVHPPSRGAKAVAHQMVSRRFTLCESIPCQMLSPSLLSTCSRNPGRAMMRKMLWRL